AMIRSSACQRQADPFPALSGRHGERQSYTTPWDTIFEINSYQVKLLASLAQSDLRRKTAGAG
ncbi:hypothetical protein ACCS67_33350, partial [Rhizobium brockwellii]|uniref:hypothetical protein n=1 Tax=Rhizobium brockwellii TaxID=3019932 RepID=UPI003F9C3F6C